MTARKGESAWDNWSWLHLASGAGLGIVGMRATWALAVIVGFEALEASLRRIRRSREGAGLFEHESWPNIFADIAVGAAGFLIGRAARSAAIDRP